MAARYFLFLAIVLGLSGCYSFRGVSIPSDISTFFVDQVKLSATLAPADSPERFMEQLRLKVRSLSSLKWKEQDPDVGFECEITDYRVTNEASTAGNNISLNKLTISVRMKYISYRNDEDSFTKSYSFGVPFDPSLDLNDVQDGFIEEIFEQISDQIFNDAFTNW